MAESSQDSAGQDGESRAPFKPLVFVVSAPSGAGKSTLVDGLIGAVPDLRRVVTCTTRPPRGGERDGDAYHFLDRAEFDARIERGDFIEWKEIYGDRYGTSRQVFDEAFRQVARRGEDLVLVIDVDGAESFLGEYGEAVTIFVLPPSIDELRRRLGGGRFGRAAPRACREGDRPGKLVQAPGYQRLEAARAQRVSRDRPGRARRPRRRFRR